MQETIEWKSVEDELPDSDITVLVYSANDLSVWLGYYDEDLFISVGGEIAPHVTHWADMPFGPGSTLQN